MGKGRDKRRRREKSLAKRRELEMTEPPVIVHEEKPEEPGPPRKIAESPR